MTRTTKPSTPSKGQTPAASGQFLLITQTASGSAQELWRPDVPSPSIQYLFVSAYTIAATTVTLSMGFGGVAMGQVMEQDIPPKSGMNLVLDWEAFAADLDGIWVWATEADVITLKFSVATR